LRTCCVDSAQSYELWLFWDLLCWLSAVIWIITVLRPAVLKFWNRK
jgi:hypothetical protein